MQENRNESLDPRPPQSQPRRFVYRSVEPDAPDAHPMRRSTDTPRPFRGIAGEICPQPVLLKFRVYLKLN
jgi:hypothetical protein